MGPRLLARVILAVAATAAATQQSRVVVVLGDNDDTVMSLRMKAANQYVEESPGQAMLVLAGNAKKELPASTRVGEMADKMARMVRAKRNLRGTALHPCVVQQRASNNTAQHLVCTDRVLRRLGVEPRPLVVVTSRYHSRRVRAMAEILAGLDPRWIWRQLSIVAADDPSSHRWRRRDEDERHLSNAKSDLDRALRADCRVDLATCAEVDFF